MAVAFCKRPARGSTRRIRGLRWRTTHGNFVLKKRLIANFGANGFAQVINTLMQVVTVPMFLFAWTKEQYGEWIIISSIPTYLSLAEAGFVSVSANKVSMLIADNNPEEARSVLHTACGFLLVVSGVLAVMAGLGAFLIPWTSLLQLKHLSPQGAAIVVAYLVAYTIIGLLAGIFEVVYRAGFRNSRIVMLRNFAKLAEIAWIGLCVWTSPSMITLAAGLATLRLISFAWMFQDSFRLPGGFHLGLKSFSSTEFKEMVRPSLLFMAFPLGNAVYYQGLTLVAGALLGPAAVVVYNSTRTFTRIPVQMVTILRHSMWPEFSYLYGERNFARARSLNNLAFELTFVISIAGSVLLFLVAPWFFALWTHGAVVVPEGLLALFLVSAVLNCFWWLASGFLCAVNHHEAIAWRYLVATVISLIAAALVGRALGLYGVALAMLACEILMVPYSIRRSCQILGYAPGTLFRSMFHLNACRELLASRRKSKGFAPL
jgi:O-antigen/teichoic acid export membrane protein